MFLCLGRKVHTNITEPPSIETALVCLALRYTYTTRTPIVVFLHCTNTHACDGKRKFVRMRVMREHDGIYCK